MRTLSGCLLTLVLALPVWATDTPRHGFHFTDNADQNENWSRADSRIPLTGNPVNSLIICGQLGNSTTIYLGPANVADATGENGEGANAQASAGGTVCNALDSATEATADAPAYTDLPMRIIGMYCKAVTDSGATGSGSNGVVFSLRSAAAEVSPALTCTVPTAGTECIAQPAKDSPLPTIAAGATIAVKTVTTEDLSADDGWCRVWYTLF